eukprot:COSAG03_NODE_18284_length_358_cov_0.764479_1_plen_26_part_10
MHTAFSYVYMDYLTYIHVVQQSEHPF